MLALVALLLALSAPPAHAVQPHAGGTHAVPIRQYAYQPATMTIRVGDTVTWTNEDQAPHDVVTSAGPAALQSPMLETGQSWTYTFTVAGTYSYYCSIHPDMRAQITVLPEDTPEPQAPQAPPPPQIQSPQVIATTPAVTTETVSPTTTVPQAASTTTPSGLHPMLLLAGLVAAVATFCLLLIGSRPDKE